MLDLFFMFKNASDQGGEYMRGGRGRERGKERGGARSKYGSLLSLFGIDVALAILEGREKILHFKPQTHTPHTGPPHSHASLGGRMVVLASGGNRGCRALAISSQDISVGSAPFQQLPHRD